MVFKVISLCDMRTYFIAITTEPTSKVEQTDAGKHFFFTPPYTHPQLGGGGGVTVLYNVLARNSKTGKQYESVPFVVFEGKKKEKAH